MRLNVVDLLEGGADAGLALVDGDRRLGRAALRERIARTAAGLRARGLQPGDRVAVVADKTLETVLLLFGVMRAGLVAVPVNPGLKPAQMAHVVDDAGARLLAATPVVLEAVLGALAGPRPQVLSTADPFPDADPLAVLPVTDRTPAAILYTSGSTGRPKGVVLSHRNLVAGAESVAAYLGNTPDDRLLAALPLSFDAGLSQLTTGFASGACVVLHHYLLPQDCLRRMAAEGITGLTAVPPLWQQLARCAWPPEAARALRYFASTGGRMPRATLQALRERAPRAAPVLMYGLTEAFRSTWLPPDEVDRRPDSIGRAIPGADVRVLRPDGTECAPHEPGELVHRGATVTLGYWRAPELTAARFRPLPDTTGGQLPTELAVWSGDLVRRDEDGFLYFVSRQDELIKSAGHRVSPTEIEDVLHADPGVAECAVLGVDDEALGQAIVAFVQPAQGVAAPELEAALRTRCRRELANWMQPARFHVMPDGLPRNPNGKMDRTRLRQRAQAPDA